MDHILVDAEELEALALHVVDEPEGVIDARERLDHCLAQVERVLDLLLVANLVVHVLEAADDARGAVVELEAGELDAVVAHRLAEDAAEGDAVDDAPGRAGHDRLGRGRLEEALAVLLVDEVGIEGEGVGEARDPGGLAGGQQVDHVLVDAEELEALGTHVVDEPHGVIDPRERLDHGLAQIERVADLLLAADLVVHVPEAADDGAPLASHLEAGELDAVVAGTVLEDAAEGDRVEGAAARVLGYGRRRHGVEEGLAVLVVDEVGVEGEGVGEAAHPPRGLRRHEVRELLVDAEELEVLGLEVLDEPHGVVVARERLDNRAGEGPAVLHRLALLGDVRDENVVEALVDLGGDVVAVVVDPPHAPVAAHDAVLHVVEVAPGLAHLLLDGAGDALVVLGVHHAAEGEAREGLELLQGVATEDLPDGPVGVEQLLRAVGLVDEEAARHVLAELLDDRQALLVEDKGVAEHVRLLTGLNHAWGAALVV